QGPPCGRSAAPAARRRRQIPFAPRAEWGIWARAKQFFACRPEPPARRRRGRRAAAPGAAGAAVRSRKPQPPSEQILEGKLMALEPETFRQLLDTVERFVRERLI